MSVQKKDDLIVQKWRRRVAAAAVEWAGSVSVLWSAAKMAAGIIMIIVQPSMNRTIVIVGKDATMTWLTVPILLSYKLHEQA